MKRKEISAFMAGKTFMGNAPELVETHISWVIMGPRRVYKIKKPVRFSFLNFSTLPLRQRYCFEEVRLNRRLTGDMYMSVEEIRRDGQSLVISHDPTFSLVDYAVKMRRMNDASRLDRRLQEGTVSRHEMAALAEVLSVFHRRMLPVRDLDPMQIRQEWNDLLNYSDALGKAGEIADVIRTGQEFLDARVRLLQQRLRLGMYRDVHGDVHSENIFLTDPPVIFDCIEFNESFRRIDLLNEVAFLCMDLEARGRPDLAQSFLDHYLHHNPIFFGPEEKHLFIFYKMYRAGVRAKIAAIHSDPHPHRIERYVRMLQYYAGELADFSGIDAGHMTF